MDTGGDKGTYLFGIPYVNLPTYAVKPSVGTTPVPKHVGVNFELLEEMYTFISNHPQSWKQSAWFLHVDRETGVTRYTTREEEVTDANVCGSSFCFAGHVALHEGFPLPPKNNNDSWARQIDGNEDWDVEEVQEFAEKVLGITSTQADALFSASNDLNDIRNYIDLLKINPELFGEELEEIGYMTEEYDLSIEEAYKKYTDDNF